MYFYRARYLDSSLGRFISEDPIGFEGGINFHIYARNTPTEFFDPFGLFCEIHTKSLFLNYENKFIVDPWVAPPIAMPPFYATAGHRMKRCFRGEKFKVIRWRECWEWECGKKVITKIEKLEDKTETRNWQLITVMYQSGICASVPFSYDSPPRCIPITPWILIFSFDL